MNGYQKLWWDDVQFLRYGARWTDGRTDRRMEKVADDPPKKQTDNNIIIQDHPAVSVLYLLYLQPHTVIV